MTLRAHIAVFVCWPVFQVVRLAAMIWSSIAQAVAPTCTCPYLRRIRNEWVAFSSEAWRATQANQIQNGWPIAISTEFASALCGDWGRVQGGASSWRLYVANCDRHKT